MIQPPSLDALMDHVSRTDQSTLDAGESERLLLPLIWDSHHRLGIVLSQADTAYRCHPGASGQAQATACRVLDRLEGAADADRPLRILFTETLPELARLSKPERWLRDPEGIEEFVRLILRELNVPPKGETEARAADRLQSVSLLERRRLLKVSREAENRARAIREALQAKAAQEAADKYQRE
jgi:hypothetical protein